MVGDLGADGLRDERHQPGVEEVLQLEAPGLRGVVLPPLGELLRGEQLEEVVRVEDLQLAAEAEGEPALGPASEFPPAPSSDFFTGVASTR